MRRKSKLMPRGDGPFQILEKLNDNAYKLNLPGEYNVSATFNVADLSPFCADDDLRTNPFQEEGNDEHVIRSTPRWSPEPLQISTGPMTRARAKRFKDALNGLIQEVFTSRGSKFITEDEPELVHMIGTGDMARFGDMDGDVAL